MDYREKILEELQKSVYELRDLRDAGEAKVDTHVASETVYYFIKFAERILGEQIEIRQWKVINK